MAAHPLVIKLLQSQDELTSTMSEQEIEQLAQALPVKVVQKGDTVQEASDAHQQCFFVLHGGLRMYRLDDGKEHTLEFYTQGQAALSFEHYGKNEPCGFYLQAICDSILLIGSPESEKEMYQQYPALMDITRNMMAQHLGQSQQKLHQHTSESIESRYQRLIDERADLVAMVPQHQLASYLGLTPESLSRLKRRLNEQK